MEARGKKAIVLSLNIYFWLPSCQGLFRVFSGWVPRVNKFRIPIISGTGAALTSDLLSHKLPGGRGVGVGWGGWERRRPPRGAQHLLCSAGSVCQAVGGKRAWSHQPTLRQKSPETLPSALRASPGFFREVVRKANFWELVGEAWGPKRDEHGKATSLAPGLGLPCRDPAQWAFRVGSGAGVRSQAAAAAAAARPGGATRAPPAQFPVRPRGGAGAADQVTERSSGAAGSCLVLSRRRRRRRHT